MNPSLTGAVTSKVSQEGSFFMLTLGFLFVITGILLAISVRYDTTGEYSYDNPAEDFVDSDEERMSFEFKDNKTKIKPENRTVKNV